MEYVLRSFQRAGVFSWLYMMSLFFGFHFFATHYINSSFLERYVAQQDVGLLIASGSFLSLIVLGAASLFIQRFGNYDTALIALGINFCALLGLATVKDVGLIFVFFAIHFAMAPLAFYCLDIFLESNTKDENTTGRIRGIFLSMGLIASLFAPTLSGYIAGDSAHYELVYLVSAVFLLPVFVMLFYRFRHFEDPKYDVLSVTRMFSAVWHNKDVFHISMAQFLMRFFFSWYVVYLPIYLHQHVGFSWPEIGVILFIMLLPYVLIEYPAGRIADTMLGEKELLVAGFIIAGVATAPLFWLDSTNVWLWGGILALTRVGTALIESMTETYFFKQIDGDDASILSTFRMLRPFGYIIGPLVASALLLVVDMSVLWIILAAVMLVGIIHPLSIKDTR